MHLKSLLSARVAIALVVVLSAACQGTPDAKEPVTSAAAPTAEPSATPAPTAAATAEPSATAAPTSAPTAAPSAAATVVPAAKTPIALVDAGEVANGKKLYEQERCTNCHGTREKPGARFPNLFKLDWSKAGEIDHAFVIIKKGDAPMPAYGDRLDEKQIGDIVAFLRSK
jgi:mono/diheme cytochrome c family protein